MDESALDVFCQHTNIEAYNGGKRHNKFDFVLLNWRDQDANVSYDDNMDGFLDFIKNYGKVPVLCVLSIED